MHSTTMREGFKIVSGEAACSLAWAGRGMSLFVINSPTPRTVDLEAVALRDVIACTVIIGDNGATTDFAVGNRRCHCEGSDMTMVFVPHTERFRFTTRAKRGLKAVMLVVDPIATLGAYGLDAAGLPESLLETIEARQTVMEKLTPGRFGMIATDIISRHGLVSGLAPLYYEGKSLELFATLLNQLSHRKERRADDAALDPRTLERLREVKRTIERAPHRAMDIDALARAAAMNRTKLRALFKQAFGTTLRAYRTTILLQQADRALKERSSTVERIAYGAGYANASSFIVAYKRHFGVSPGLITRFSRSVMLRL